MNQTINMLVNDNFRVLNFMYENKIKTDDGYKCVLSQLEVAQAMNLNKMTINRIIRNLKKSELLITSNKNKEYFFSDNALKILKKINSITF